MVARLCERVSLAYNQVSQFSAVTPSFPTLSDPMDGSTPGLPVLYYLPELAQAHMRRVGDASQPSHPVLAPSLALSLSQHQALSQLFTSGGQSIVSSASASVLPMNIQG